VERILLRFTKGKSLRFVGHLDLMRAFERAMRRSRFPVGYSQGFNPRPRMAFASALTLGATSECELCQLELAEDLTEERLRAELDALGRHLPPGLDVLGAWAIPLEKRNPYIQVQAAEFFIALAAETDRAAVEQVFGDGPGQVPISDWKWEAGPDGPRLRVRLPAGERHGVRIRDVTQALQQRAATQVTHLHRSRLWCELEPEERACVARPDPN
jgi:hypothetical protein